MELNDGDRGWGGVIAFWAILVGGVAIPLLLSGTGINFVGKALALGAAAAAATALVFLAVVAVGGIVVLSVMALLRSKGGT